ncbi:MAG: hypothetical protein ACK4S8_03010 [Alishewanella aestuarii]
MSVLCYQIAARLKPNEKSTTGAQDGHLSVVIKSDQPECKAQVYSELVANRLAMFLGIPVALGVPAKSHHDASAVHFASLKAHEADRDFYDFTDDDDRAEEPPEDAPEGLHIEQGHLHELISLSKIYPKEISYIAVFDLWIGNEDRPLNFKAELSKGDRGVLFAVDHGSSLLACRSNLDASLELLYKETYPSFHPFQKLVNPVFVGQMIERICSMPDWAIESATVFNDIIGNVTLAEQYAMYSVLIERKRMLNRLVNTVF